MNKNPLWKIVLIVALVVGAAAIITPINKRLKPGLDLAGGTSLIYSIDTEGMESDEIKGLSQKMIPIILRRIDPTGVANIVIRPQGDTRLEIQLPLASKDTRDKRQDYQDSLDALEAGNVNIARIVHDLSLDPKLRLEKFSKYAKGSEQKLEILKNLAQVNDKREKARSERDALNAEKQKLAKELETLTVSPNTLDYKISDWAKLSGEALDKAITKFVKPGEDDKPLSAEQISKKGLLIKYVDAYKSWAKVVNQLTEDNGLNSRFDSALTELSKLNINTDALARIMETPARTEYLDRLKADFPERKEQIEKFVNAFEEYKTVRGRLDDPEDLKRMLKGSGVLEFRILPSLAAGTIESDLAQSYILDLKKKGPKQASDSNYVWIEIENINEWQNAGSVVAEFADTYYVLASNKPNQTLLQKQDGKWKLEKASPGVDQAYRRAIDFQLNEIGAKKFFKLTSKNIDAPLCIILDNKAISAPKINSAIRDRGQITGSYSYTEQIDMVNKLNAGSLPARISEAPISEKTIGATIGEEYRDKGIKAGIYGLIIVAFFMLVYYLIAGGLADIALVMNILFILAVMAFTGATFTLPGIAGLILTIGMSVDANVLIFERIREEMLSGNSLRIALNNGYKKAFRTILDANVTTFITAMILYLVASEEIKGFATVLMIGIVSSMFTALFVTRVFFNSLITRGIIKDKLPMLSIVKAPSFNWMGAKKAFFTISAILIVSGLSIFFTRDDAKSNKYDIEFTGGTSVQVNFKEGTDLDLITIEKKIHAMGEEYGSSGLMAAKVYSVGETGRQFEINTIETNKSIVEINFANVGETTESIKAAVEAAADKFDAGVRNISVKATDNPTDFVISTSQLAKSEVRQLMASAFEDKEYKLSEPVVDEIVNRAITEAFGDVLERQENLKPTITSAKLIDDAVLTEKPELTEYISGLMIECNLENEVNAGQLKARFKSLMFKKDMEDFAWYKYVLLADDATKLEDDATVNKFMYVSLHPDAGYRELDKDELERYISSEKEKIIAATSIETSLPRVTQFNPSIGNESKRKALVAIILSLFAIVGYIWIRFGDARFGFAAIAALVHDVCITLGAVTICTYIAGTSIGEALGIRDFKINLQMIAAFLTIIGYSLNDTIVVFDRIRENRGKLTTITPDIVTKSINQTLSRTLLTSLTTFIVVLVMYIGGGIGLRGFTFAMLVGILIGTYSSIAIASPILLIGKKSK